VSAPVAPWVLYGAPSSGSAVVECALVRCGLPYRVKAAVPWAAKPRGMKALTAVNPLAQIPTLVAPDGRVLTESAAILIALGLAFRGSRLLPAREPARALHLRALLFVAANCYPAIGVIDYPGRWTTATDEASLDAVRAGTRARLHRLWELYADQFVPAARMPFFGGERPAAADLFAAVVSRWSGARAHLASARPAFHAQMQAVQDDPATRDVFRRHRPKKAPA
jgi:GST-like protein